MNHSDNDEVIEQEALIHHDNSSFHDETNTTTHTEQESSLSLHPNDYHHPSTRSYGYHFHYYYQYSVVQALRIAPILWLLMVLGFMAASVWITSRDNGATTHGSAVSVSSGSIHNGKVSNISVFDSDNGDYDIQLHNVTDQSDYDTVASATPSINVTDLMAKANVSDRVVTQLDNYRNGTGLLINVHITHHAGTTVCGKLGRAVNARRPAPSFACLLDYKTLSSNATWNATYNPALRPWRYNETDGMIQAVVPDFHMISWEFSHINVPRERPLADTDWEHPQLVSILVVRDPMSRMLARDGWVSKKFPGLLHRDGDTEEEWWEFAHHTRNDNFALRILAGGTCCSGANTSRAFLTQAQELVSRFSFVVDIACLNESLYVIAALTGLSMRPLKPSHAYPPMQERFYNMEIYNYLRDVNQLDIELYEWARQRAVVQCDSL
jgi:hypothetical protein